MCGVGEDAFKYTYFDQNTVLLADGLIMNSSVVIVSYVIPKTLRGMTCV